MQHETTLSNPGMALADAASTPPRPLWRRAWEGWMRFAHVLGVINTRIIMFIFFFIFVLPIGLVLQLLRDPLHIKHPPDTNWVPHPHDTHGLDSAHQQF